MTRPKNVFDRLNKAAGEIVGIVRKAMADSGEAHPERIPLYMPVVIAGTDLRVVIEAGPTVAANNAIQQAMACAGAVPKLSFAEAVRQAADIIASQAVTLGAEHDELREQWTVVVDALNRGR